MVPLVAELSSDAQSANARGAARRTLRLEVEASSSRDSTRALIRNLSEKGLLIETAAPIAIGDSIQVDLPEAGASAARVIWSEGSFHGCQFLRPLSRAAVSAALLRAPAEPPQPITSLPELPANAPFAEDGGEVESDPHGDSSAVTMVANISLITMAIVAALFAYALLALSISG